MSMLADIVAHKREEVAERARRFPLQALQADLQGYSVRALPLRNRRTPISVIAEFKRRSPSKGDLRPDADVGSIVTAYETHGAAALSVLTDERFFGGRADDLRVARRTTDLPVLRKDFIIDEYQLWESAYIGADAVLLIARVLDDAQLRDYLAVARGGLGLAALVEVHDERELERALAAGATLVGVNNRNLDTFETSLETCLRIKRAIPAEVITVAESGIESRADVERLEAAGFDAILVGETLMRAENPGEKLRELLGVQGWQENSVRERLEPT